MLKNLEVFKLVVAIFGPPRIIYLISGTQQSISEVWKNFSNCILNQIAYLYMKLNKIETSFALNVNK